jgi:predicted acylesterase/phospholipase RssA
MKKILSIDGGGIKGLFPASFLASIEDAMGDKVANYFDLIVGTSTGGIIALGLGFGLSAGEILSFYEQSGPLIFPGNRFIKFLRWFGFSKYNQKPLKEALISIFGDKKLGESAKRLVIPSFNLETGEVHIYKTSHHPRLERDYKNKVVDVALATAAAPTYFPTHRSSAGTPLIDGGVWANNPVGLAAVEDSFKILSIGCTSEPLNIGLGRKYAFGWGYWGPKIISVFMTAQSSSSLGTAQLLAGTDNILRINPMVPRGRFGLDAIEEIPSLKGLGDSEARKAIPSLRPIFFIKKAEDFTPYKMLND